MTVNNNNYRKRGIAEQVSCDITGKEKTPGTFVQMKKFCETEKYNIMGKNDTAFQVGQIQHKNTH